jgi:hypothetical protein
VQVRVVQFCPTSESTGTGTILCQVREYRYNFVPGHKVQFRARSESTVLCARPESTVLCARPESTVEPGQRVQFRARSESTV